MLNVNKTRGAVVRKATGFLLLLSLFTGCSSRENSGILALEETPELLATVSRSEQTSTPKSKVTTSIGPNTSLPIASVSPISSVSPELRDTPRSEFKLDRNCITYVNEQESAYTGPGGVLILRDVYNEGVYLIDLSSKLKIIPNQVDESFRSIVVSPDYRFFAGISIEYNEEVYFEELQIYDASGALRLKPLFLYPNWFTIASWINDDQILIGSRIIDENNNPTAGNAPLILLNPYTNEWNRLPISFPKYINIYPYVNWGGFSISGTVYSPSLDFVVFPKMGQSSSITISLWDLLESRSIIDLTGGEYISQVPLWSSDGDGFLINLSLSKNNFRPESNPRDEELFLVNTDGEIERLTYLIDLYEEVLIGNYSLSPDERFIAFWANVRPYEKSIDAAFPEQYTERLYLFDRVSKTITDFCVTSSLINWNPPPTPVWSPDNIHIAVAQAISENEVVILIIDISNNSASLLTDESYPVGWLIKDPLE